MELKDKEACLWMHKMFTKYGDVFLEALKYCPQQYEHSPSQTMAWYLSIGVMAKAQEKI